VELVRCPLSFLPVVFLPIILAIRVVTYSETLEYLFALHRFGVKLGLDAISDILHKLKNPQRRYATLHIAGTNGKGSSAAMVAAMLQAGGYRVGLYTSPHLMDFRERIRVQDHDISTDCVCELTENIRRIANPLSSLTFFELTTALAFQYFLDQRVDIAVVEVGLGGRYDATNVLDPLGVLITGIGLDHEMYLGQTLQAIAREKAGIIQQQVPVVLGPMLENVSRIFKDIAQDYDAPLYRYGQEFSISATSQTGFSYSGIRESLPDLQTNLPGRHQMTNAGNALALLEAATAEQFPLSADAITFGLQHVRWKGRLEIVQHNPMIILDGAHNPSGAHVLFDFLQSQLHDCPGRKLIVILGMMEEKNHSGFLQIILPLVDSLFITQPHMNGAATVETLAQAVLRKDLKPSVIVDPWEAYCQARNVADVSDLICVTGSLFLVGEILQHLHASHSPMIRS
jgi:dihydrofolate synthase/folylpolyglutamate synthase